MPFEVLFEYEFYMGVITLVLMFLLFIGILVIFFRWILINFEVYSVSVSELIGIVDPVYLETADDRAPRYARSTESCL